jgi:hypothetical protein
VKNASNGQEAEMVKTDKSDRMREHKKDKKRGKEGGSSVTIIIFQPL